MDNDVVQLLTSVRLFATPWTAACQAPPSMGFSRQEYWNGCHCLLHIQTRQHIKSRDITLPTKVHLVKVMVFPVVMYGCKSWAMKRAEHWRADTFELWCWRRVLRVPWTARRSNQSILTEISPEYSLGGLVLQLKLQYFGHLIRELTHWKWSRCWERLKAG